MSRWPARCSADPQLLVLDEPTVGLDPVAAPATCGNVRRPGRRRRSTPVGVEPRDGRSRALRSGACSCATAACSPTTRRTICDPDTGTDDLDEAFLRLVDEPSGGRLMSVRIARTPPSGCSNSSATTGGPSRSCSSYRSGCSRSSDSLSTPTAGVSTLRRQPCWASSRSCRCSSSPRSRCCASAPAGTLERLLTTPVEARPARRLRPRVRARRRRASAALCVARLWLLDLDIAGSAPLVVVLAVANAVLGMAMGLFLSAFAVDRVPGRAVHAGVRAPPVAAVRCRCPRERHGDTACAGSQTSCP